ncbi:hypothetical protein GALMADRAFT_250920 [Galerina marginata CBS 339.88]|uniref:Uncharacterized protein n=1 Tax=Galerina marginata (strain CBS 339.88) TaxID=685588 RepID=A0A067ST50_GALM3|nr:hypothetical protein GALMADRAFT_250920 [Galerina marginata CBS 339.88]
MRLLRVDGDDLTIEEFLDDKKRPDYAILSHTWGDDEVSFQDFSTPAAIFMAGYSKIMGFRELARQDGFKYVWIDTCCIDKTSSSELSEAINSMYQWYQSATVCYVYLSDVEAGDSPSASESQFSKSRWFTRGWTLQELLAPRIVIFYDCNWVEIGSKASLQDDISRIAQIQPEALSSQPMDQISIAQRMSWAAMRQTTKVEDIAYCLMGIFGVNMPTLYGEGRQAFVRLQYEIMKSSDDHSLFAWDTASWLKRRLWTDTDEDTFPEWMMGRARNIETGLLASTPKQFQYAQGVRRLEVANSRYTFSMTNKGLHIRLPLVQVHLQGLESVEIYQAILSCQMTDGIGPLSIYLKRNPSGQYSRIFTSVVRTAKNVQQIPEPVELYVKEAYHDEATLRDSDAEPVKSECTFRFTENLSAYQGYTLLEPGPKWDLNSNSLHLSTTSYKEVASSDMSYVLVKPNNDPTVRVMVILGVQGYELKSSRNEYDFFSHILSTESEIEEAVETIGSFARGKNKYIDDETFNRGRITKQLRNGYNISVAIRVGPRDAERSIEVYSVTMEFTSSDLPLPSLSVRRPINFGAVDPEPNNLNPLPKLVLYPEFGIWRTEFYPRNNWSLVGDPELESPIRLWTPTKQHKTTLIRLTSFSHSIPEVPLLMLFVINSGIALKLVDVPSDWSWEDSDRGLSLCLAEAEGTMDGKQYQLPSDFPLEIVRGASTMRIEMKPRLLLDDMGLQMRVDIK